MSKSLGSGDPNYSQAAVLSVIGHICGVFLAVYLAAPRIPDFGESIVYSISIEGGKSLGGMSQVPKDDKKTQQAPPKNSSNPENKNEEKVKIDPKVEKQKAELEKKAEEEKVKENADLIRIEEEKKKEQQKQKEEEKRKDEEKKKEEQRKKDESDKKRKEEDEKKRKAADEKAKADAEKKRKEEEVNKKYQQAMQRYSGESTDAGGKGFGAGKLGGNAMGGGVQRPPEFFYYRDLIRTEVKRGWTWYDTRAALKAAVTFRISERGEISGATIETSSGNREYDDSVLRAVYKASPLEPPPANVYQFFKVVKVEFDPTD